jgi:hypothetical protein
MNPYRVFLSRVGLRMPPPSRKGRRVVGACGFPARLALTPHRPQPSRAKLPSHVEIIETSSGGTVARRLGTPGQEKTWQW